MLNRALGLSEPPTFSLSAAESLWSNASAEQHGVEMGGEREIFSNFQHVKREVTHMFIAFWNKEALFFQIQCLYAFNFII